ncbi:unnamed protein product [Peronospora farinosa]|uniref:Uncharacterized protein n=1 Tax=Peronospora farinosa TaxID=134698 RepID=A0AAV0UN70_9STRA|nr:unnamed protein product [Peronospora farinosa]
MVSLTSILAMVTFVATTVDYVEAHGFECLLALFKKLRAANNYKDVRSLMDGNPLYGKDCGHTDPKAKPVPPPSNGQATFSRPIGHSGPCELWLNNKRVFYSDDCQSSHPDGIFKPVDYSLCGSNSCILRFYWLALQRKGKNTVWQAYKNCINILGPSGGGGDNDVSQEELSGNSNVSQNNTASKFKDNSANKNELKKSDESKDSKKESNESKDLKKESKDSSKESKKDLTETPPAGGDSSQTPPAGGDSSQTPPAGGDSSQTPPAGASPQTPPPETPGYSSASLPGTPAMTPAPNSKCKGRRRRRY